MKAYFSFPGLPKELYINPTTETVIWTAAFTVMFGLVLWICWLDGRPPKK